MQPRRPLYCSGPARGTTLETFGKPPFFSRIAHPRRRQRQIVLTVRLLARRTIVRSRANRADSLSHPAVFLRIVCQLDNNGPSDILPPQ